MSGGSMNYLHSLVAEAKFALNTPEQKAFFAHLQKVAKALHDIEWVDSGDYGNGQEIEAIQECLRDDAVLEEMLKEASEMVVNLNYEIHRVRDLINDR